MTRAAKTTALLSLCVAITAAILIATLWRSNQTTHAADRASSSTTSAMQLAQEIKSLRSLTPQSERAASEILPLAQLAEQAAQTADLPLEAVDRVTPEPPRALKDTPYTLEPTTLMLRSVPLEKLPSFIQAIQLSSPTDPLTVERIRLIAPRQTANSNTQETWDIETTLTRKTYVPAPGNRTSTTTKN